MDIKMEPSIRAKRMVLDPSITIRWECLLILGVNLDQIASISLNIHHSNIRELKSKRRVWVEIQLTEETPSVRQWIQCIMRNLRRALQQSRALFALNSMLRNEDGLTLQATLLNEKRTLILSQLEATYRIIHSLQKERKISLRLRENREWTRIRHKG